MAPCDPLVEITKATAPDILETLVENNRRFAECRIKYEELLELLR